MSRRDVPRLTDVPKPVPEPTSRIVGVNVRRLRVEQGLSLLMPHTRYADGPDVLVTGLGGEVPPSALLAWLTGFRALSGADATTGLPQWAYGWALDDSETMPNAAVQRRSA